MSDLGTKSDQDQSHQHKKVLSNKQILTVLNLVWKWIIPPSSPTHFPKLLCPTEPYNMRSLIKQIKDQQKKYEEYICSKLSFKRSLKEFIQDSCANRNRYHSEHHFRDAIAFYKQKEANNDSIIEIYRYKQDTLKNNTYFFARTLSLLRMCCFEMNDRLKYTTV